MTIVYSENNLFMNVMILYLVRNVEFKLGKYKKSNEHVNKNLN